MWDRVHELLLDTFEISILKDFARGKEPKFDIKLNIPLPPPLLRIINGYLVADGGCLACLDERWCVLCGRTEIWDTVAHDVMRFWSNYSSHACMYLSAKLAADSGGMRLIYSPGEVKLMQQMMDAMVVPGKTMHLY